MLPSRTFYGVLFLALLPASSAFVQSHTVDLSLIISGAPRLSPGVSRNDVFAQPVSLPTTMRANVGAGPITTQQGAFQRTTTTLHATKKLKREDSLSSPASFDHALHRGRMLFRCQIAILMYMLTGVIAFSRIFERWPIIDALYFSVVTFTTVGYGDLCPTTDAGKLFTIFYAFAGISIVGALLGYIGGSVIEAERAAIQKTRAAARAAMMELFDPKKKRRKGGSTKGTSEEESTSESHVTKALAGDGSRSSSSTDDSGLGTIRGIVSNLFSFRRHKDGKKSLLRSAFDTFTDSYYIFVPFLGLAAIIGKNEGWNSITSIYYAMATATTVGWGDVSPSSPQMRLLSLVFIPLAVISLGEVLGRIAGVFIRKNTLQAEREFMSRRMTLDDLEAMDVDKNGEVDQFEFLTFMLGSMQKVEPEMMMDLKDLFERLDVNGSGTIQKEDLVLMAQKKRDPWNLRKNQKK